MKRPDPQAFIETTFVQTRACTLNQAVYERGIAILVGGPGTGKDRFLDWWWQEGASNNQVREELCINPNDIVLINLVPAPRSSVPMACVAMSMLWSRLRELDRIARCEKYIRPTGKLAHWHTETQFLSLFFDNILPLLRTLQPRAVVVSNAQYLDERTLHWLLLLRTHGEFGHALLPRHALILAAQLEPGGEESSKFAQLIHNHSETKQAWVNKLKLSPMSKIEEVHIFASLLSKNLMADFATDLDTKEITKKFYGWTQGNWWYIAELAKRLDEVLGPVPVAGGPRIITQNVIKRLEERWVKT